MCCTWKHGHQDHAYTAETYPHDASRYCRCLGLNNGHTDNPAEHGKCCGAATGDDGLCDRCRATCNKAETAEQSIAPGPGAESQTRNRG